VRKRYGSVEALRGLTGVVSGERVGLLGPNGAGKSTLIKALLGFTPFEGEARVLGLSPKTEAFAIRDRVGYMPETESHLAGMNAVELCTYAGELSGLPRQAARERAHAALYLVNLEDKRYLKVEGYSTGLKQRVKLAQALVHDPDLLFLDEPTNGLDPAGREDILGLIADLPGKRGTKFILSSHLLPDIERADLVHRHGRRAARRQRPPPRGAREGRRRPPRRGAARGRLRGRAAGRGGALGAPARGERHRRDLRRRARRRRADPPPGATPRHARGRLPARRRSRPQLARGGEG